MAVYNLKLEEGEIILHQGAQLGNNQLEIMEIKGWGHPDKLADDLAETLSRAYARYTRLKCGVILHHNFDKLCLLGGSSEVRYGSAKMTHPIKVLVNGRATNKFGSVFLDVESLIIKTCKNFFQKRLPLVDPQKDLSIILNLSSSSSPGKVISKENSGPRHRWFSPSGIEDLPEVKRLYANDTSLGTGFFPLSETESLVKALCDYLSKRPRSKCPIWLGTDVKVMAYSFNSIVDLTICVPQIARYVENRKAYIDNLAWLRQDIYAFLKTHFPDIEVTVNLNARDQLEKDEIYLTAIGSSIESGDEGVVGRGNRVNGLITPMRPMNLEGANGKNPVYHVGKIYNVLANFIAKKVYEKVGGNVVVHLISKAGGNLLTPWKTLVQIEKTDIDKHELIDMIRCMCTKIPSLTTRLVNSCIEQLPLS